MGRSLAVIWNRGLGPHPLSGLLQSQLPKYNTHSAPTQGNQHSPACPPRGGCGVICSPCIKIFYRFSTFGGRQLAPACFTGPDSNFIVALVEGVASTHLPIAWPLRPFPIRHAGYQDSGAGTRPLVTISGPWNPMQPNP